MRALTVILALGLGCGIASAHLCNNIYRTPDRIIIKSEKDELLMETAEEVRIFVRNNFPTHLRQVRLVAEIDDAAVNAAVTPEMIPELKPGEKYEFTVKVTAGPGAAQGKHRLKLSVGAEHFGFEPVHEISDQELIRALDDPKGNASAHVLIVESLVRRENPQGMTLLKSFLEGGRGYKIRAIRAAGRSGNPDVIPLLTPMLQDRDGAVRGNVLLSLGMLKAELDTLQAALPDPDPFVCACAATGLLLAEAAPDGLVDELVAQRFIGNESAYVRIAAAWGAALEGRDEVLPVFEQALGTGDPEIVVFAGDALLSLADKQAKGEAEEGAEPPPPPRAPEVSADGAQAIEGAPADRLFAKLVPVAGTDDGDGGVSVQLYHSYNAPLHDVQVRVEGSDSEEPAAEMDVLSPTEIKGVTVPASALPEGSQSVVMQVSCAEFAEPVRLTATWEGEIGDEDVTFTGSTMPVGELPVRVMKLGDWYAFMWGIPLFGAILGTGVLAWRRRGRRA